MKNFRDFAYSNMKKGLLFRSEALANLSKEDQELLKKNNIKYIIDLRTPDEVAEDKDIEMVGVESINLSLLPQDKESEKEIKAVDVAGMQLPDYSIAYRQIIRPNRKEIWTTIFDLLLNKDGSFLFHCSQGKDRTGVVAAVILSALGIDEETIYKDYLLTNEGLVFSPSFEHFASTLPEEVRNPFLEHFSARKQYLDSSFDEINKVYGSFNNFLKECCSLDDNKFNRLKEKYLNK